MRAVPAALAAAWFTVAGFCGAGLWCESRSAQPPGSAMEMKLAEAYDRELREATRLRAENWTLRAAEFRERCRRLEAEAEAEEVRAVWLGQRAGADADRREAVRPRGVEAGEADRIPPTAVPTGR